MRDVPPMTFRLLSVLAVFLSIPLAAAEPVDVDVEKAEELMASEPELLVIDVRTPEEFEEGHLPKAINLDFNGDDFEAKLAKLDPTKPCLVYCAVGGRSGRSMEIFRKLKFAKVRHLEAGYQGWTDAGKPTAPR